MALNRTNIAVGATGSVMVGATGDDAVSTVMLQITQASGSFSVTPQVTLDNTGNAPANIQYKNMLSGATVAAGTAITSAGIYAIPSSGLAVSLNVGSVVTSPLVVDAALLFGREL